MHAPVAALHTSPGAQSACVAQPVVQAPSTQTAPPSARAASLHSGFAGSGTQTPRSQRVPGSGAGRGVGAAIGALAVHAHPAVAALVAELARRDAEPVDAPRAVLARAVSVAGTRGELRVALAVPAPPRAARAARAPWPAPP